MDKWVKTLIAGCLYFSGLVKVCRWWQQRGGQILVILCYHQASGGDLRRHMLYLRRHYRLLHLEDALEELYKPGKKQPVKRDRRIPLVLTFDDGYRDNYTFGLPLACDLHVPLTIFLAPGYIESGNNFWWQEGEYLVTHAGVGEVTLEGCTYDLAQIDQRKKLAWVIDTRVRYATMVSEREAFLVAARRLLAVPSIASGEESTSPLTWREVRAMQESGWISFGAHTMHHPILAYLTDPTEVRYEVSECRQLLERQLAQPVRLFAYPVGQREHIGDQVPHAVQDAGYSWAVASLPGFNTSQTSPYLLHRLEVDVNEHWLVIATRVCGLGSFLSRLFCVLAAFVTFLQKCIMNRLK